jgi:hypothetical protein
MKTREIPRDAWAAFFDDLSRQYEGRPVTIEILETDLDPEPEVRKLTLRHVAAHEESITIIAEQPPDERLTHTIVAPTSVRLAETEDGVPHAAQIQSARGMMTLIIFRAVPCVMRNNGTLRTFSRL